MGIGVTPATTVYACRAIALEMGVDEAIVKMIVGKYHDSIKKCLKAEIPFLMTGIGKFYHRYMKSNLAHRFTRAEHYRDKVSRQVVFKLSDEAKRLFNSWVHDLKIKSNLPKELVRIAIRPEEIEKIRRRKVLDDQQSLGFRSDLLFDEGNLPPSDAKGLEALNAAPSVDEIIERIGRNIDND